MNGQALTNKSPTTTAPTLSKFHWSRRRDSSMSFEDNEYTSNNVVPLLPLPDRVRSTDRVERLLATYQKNYSATPQFLVRVPGRVNLIGEHIDYCGYSVFPMALQQDIMMAVGPTPDSPVPIRLSNTDTQYPEVSIESPEEAFPKLIKWYHYVLCGWRGVNETYVDNLNSAIPPLSITVDGNLPAGSGLSSSSAMVVASTLSTLISYYSSLFKISTPIPKVEIAQVCIKCERYIGLDSGGMDQAIAILAEEGSAKIIDFIPTLNATNVQLPAGVCFYVAHCGVSMHKAATAHYNTRVAETRLAAAVIAKKLKISGYKLGDQLWVVQQASAIPLAEMGDHIAESVFDCDKEFYTKNEICSILGIDIDELEKKFLSRLGEPLDEFKLYQRARHVYEEAYRVQEFRKICESTKDVERLGQLMLESHESCQELYECSHPSLDELVSNALESGAIGARLTGAGWGGCIVAMVYNDGADDFQRRMERHCKFLFRSGPSSGSVIYEI